MPKLLSLGCRHDLSGGNPRARFEQGCTALWEPDHRELCAHERDYPFRIANLLELVGESMGLRQHDRYKELKLMQTQVPKAAAWLGFW